MLCITTQTGRRWPSVEPNVYDRLNWLIAANLREAACRRLLRNPDDEESILLMRHPIPTERAFALLGMLLGALPPAAIFYRFFDYAAPQNSPATHDNPATQALFLLLLLVNFICMLVGKKVGAKIGCGMDEAERQSWHRMILLAGFNGFCWAATTGAAGGACAFGVGAIFGALLAVPIGVLAFVFFTILHRLVAHGGMIDARHFWPLACGITMSIAAFILGL